MTRADCSWRRLRVEAFDAEDGSFEGMAELFEANHHQLSQALSACGLEVCPAQGGYFLIADVACTGLTDFEFIQWLADKVGVIAVPLQVFYCNPPERCTLVRFSICKRKAVIQNACEVITSHRAEFDELIAGGAEAREGAGAPP